MTVFISENICDEARLIQGAWFNTCKDRQTILQVRHNQIKAQLLSDEKVQVNILLSVHYKFPNPASSVALWWWVVLVEVVVVGSNSPSFMPGPVIMSWAIPFLVT